MNGWFLKIMLAFSQILFVGFALVAQEDDGFDYVWVKTDGEERVARYRGTIVDYNGTRLSLEIRGRRREFRSESVERIQTKYLAEYLDARSQAKQGDVQAAVEKLSSAVPLESRSWVQREMIGYQLELLARFPQSRERSITLFQKLIQNDPETRFFYWIPLRWTQTGILSATETDLAKSLMASDQPAEQLIGASWLIGTSDRGLAVERLRTLSTDADARVAHLAAGQIWYSELLTATESHAGRWEKQIERMPRSLKPGPLLILGQLQARLAGDDAAIVEAAKTLMSLPVLFPEHYDLAGQALKACADLMHKNARDEEAYKILVELAQRYQNSSAFDGALLQRLEQFQNKN